MQNKIPLLVYLILLITITATAGETRTFNAWNISYTIPQNWALEQQIGRLHTLKSNSGGAMIYAAPGKYSDNQQAFNAVAIFVANAGMSSTPIEQPHNTTIAGKTVYTGTYWLTNRSMQRFKAKFVTVLTKHGTGLNALLVAPSNEFDQAVASIEKIAASMNAKAPVIDRNIMRTLAGSWVYYDANSSSSIAGSGYSSRSYQETVKFDGNGGFNWHSTSHVSVDSRISSSGGWSGASNFGNNTDSGQYTVIGSTIVFVGRNGQQSFDFMLQGGKLITGNKTFLRE